MEMKATHIAPCGMNCRLCGAYTREKNPCGGCRGGNEQKPKHCVRCAIANCPSLPKGDDASCHACAQVPCRRLRKLDASYMAKHHMSMLENLAILKESGMEALLEREEALWTCANCGGVLSVHSSTCPNCQTAHGLWYSRW